MATDNSNCEAPEVHVDAAGDNQHHRLLFGWLRIRPKRLQGFLNPKWALFWLCWAGAVQGKDSCRRAVCTLVINIMRNKVNCC